jgi:hypothetical protein
MLGYKFVCLPQHEERLKDIKLKVFKIRDVLFFKKTKVRKRTVLRKRGTKRSGTKIMPFFPENVTAITIKCTRMIHRFLAIKGLFFHRVSVIFNTLLPALSKTLHANVVKFPSSIRRKLCFISLTSAKLHPRSASFTGPNRGWSEGARSGL